MFSFSVRLCYVYFLLTWQLISWTETILTQLHCWYDVLCSSLQVCSELGFMRKPAHCQELSSAVKNIVNSHSLCQLDVFNCEIKNCFNSMPFPKWHC